MNQNRQVVPQRQDQGVQQPAPQPRRGMGGGQGNAANLERLAQVQQNRGRQQQPRLTPRQQWEQAYLQQKRREVDPNVPRWRQLNAEEAAALAATPQEQRAQAGQLGYSTTVNGQTWQYDRQAHDPNDPTLAEDLMGGNAQQVYSRAFVTPGSDNPNRNDVTIFNRDGTTTTQRSNEHGMAELPATGFGFTTHNRNDVTVNGQPQPDQWGTPENIARVVNIMAAYRTLFPNSEVSIGDMSTDTGDSPRLYSNSTTRHGSHYDGTQLDLQYVDGTSSDARAPTSTDDIFRQRSFIRTAENWGMNNFYAASSLSDDLFFSPNSDVGYNRSHNDHLHMGVGTGDR